MSIGNGESIKLVENVQIQTSTYCASQAVCEWLPHHAIHITHVCMYAWIKKLPPMSSKLFDEYITICNKWWLLHIGWSLCTKSMNYNQREHFNTRLYVTKCCKHVFKIFWAEIGVHFTGSSTCMFNFLVGKHMPFKTISVIAWEGIVSVNPFCSVQRTAPAVFNYNTASTKVLASQPRHVH